MNIYRLEALALAFLLCSVGSGGQTALPAKKPGPKSVAPVIEDRALALLKRNQQAMHRLKAYKAECCTILTPEKPRPNRPAVTFYFSTLTAEKPNKMRFDHWEPAENPLSKGWKRPKTAPKNTFACDGKHRWNQLGATYAEDARIAPAALMTGDLEPWGGFYDLRSSPFAAINFARSKGTLRELRMAGREAVEGVLCEKVSAAIVSEYNGSKTEERQVWYIGPDDLMRRCVARYSFSEVHYRYTQDAVLQRIQVDQPVSPEVYVYNPPPGVTPEQPDKDLLANGTMAPDFAALDAQKRPVKLTDYRGKVVVVDFWASWCAPCIASMPHTQQVIKKLQQSGAPVVLLAVDNSEERDAFDKWVKQHAKVYADLNFVHCPPNQNVGSGLFRVSSIPTQYVIDQTGTIRASSVGFGGSNDDLEKAIRACLPSSK